MCGILDNFGEIRPAKEIVYWGVPMNDKPIRVRVKYAKKRGICVLLVTLTHSVYLKEH